MNKLTLIALLATLTGAYNVQASIDLDSEYTTVRKDYAYTEAEYVTPEYSNSFKVRGAAFLSHQELYTNIYGTSAFSGELEYVRAISNHVDLFANVAGRYKKGNSVGLNLPTSIGSLQFSFGPELAFALTERLSVYVGAGLSISNVWLRNETTTGVEKVSNTTVGVVGKSGLECQLTDRVFLDVFVDHLYQPTRYTARTVNTGGTAIGFGLGYNF